MNQLSNGKAVTKKETFSRETTVAIDIDAEPAVVWKLLTNAADMPRWNSTIVSLDGQIKKGETVKLKSTLDENRVFNLQIKEFEPNKRLVWGDRQGNREYLLTPGPDGKTHFSMREKIGGFLFPLFSRFIPDFDDSFEQFARDLKNAAEAG